MNTTVVTAIITAISTLLGVGVGAVMQLRVVRENNAFQLQLDSRKRDAELYAHQCKAHEQRLYDVHKSISKVTRAFSLTGLDIAWSEGLTVQQFDQKYLACCEEMDDAAAVCDLYIPEISNDIRGIAGEVNALWGNYKQVLYLESRDDSKIAKESFHARAREAALRITSTAARLQQSLRTAKE